MPNWMQCMVRITGPADEIVRFRAAHIREDEDGNEHLDFNSIIPMPPQLRDADHGGSDAFIWALGGDLHPSRGLLRRVGLYSADDTPLDWPWVRSLGIATREEFLCWAEKNRPDQLDMAQRAMDNESATGYRDWYDWQVDNWGCKWGCHGFMWESDDQTAFSMETPWSAPEPIFQKLVALFPSLTFACRFLEEAEEIDETRVYAA